MVPVSSDVNFRVTLDSVLSVNKHAVNSAESATITNALRHTGKPLTDDFAKSIPCAIVGYRLDYANAVLVSPKYFGTHR